MNRRRAAFLDRDGVLNEAAEGANSPLTVDELRVFANAPGVVARLKDSDYFTVIVTNQPSVSRGEITTERATELNDLVQRITRVDAVYLCPHTGADACSCRKPLPGLLLTAAAEHRLDLAQSWLIGDRWVDIEAARAARVRSVLLERPYSWSSTSAGSPPSGLRPTYRASTLDACVDFILRAPMAKRPSSIER